jgi:hypothetical protein
VDPAIDAHSFMELETENPVRRETHGVFCFFEVMRIK